MGTREWSCQGGGELYHSRAFHNCEKGGARRGIKFHNATTARSRVEGVEWTTGRARNDVHSFKRNQKGGKGRKGANDFTWWPNTKLNIVRGMAKEGEGGEKRQGGKKQQLQSPSREKKGWEGKRTTLKRVHEEPENKQERKKKGTSGGRCK